MNFRADELFDGFPTGVLVLHEGQVCYLNQAARQLLSQGGIDLEEGEPLPECLAGGEGDAGWTAQLGPVRCQVSARQLQGRQVIYLSREERQTGIPLERLELLGDVLQEPLSTISALTQLLPSAGAGELQRYQAMYFRSCYRLIRLSSNLRQLSRLERGEDCRLEPLDLAGLCRRLCQELEGLLEPLGVGISAELPATALILGNSPLLRQLVLNLTSNAVRAGAKSLCLELKRRGKQVILTFGDDGPGFTREDLAAAFDAGAGQEGFRPSGFGLGLPLCQKIAQLHRGSLLLETSPGEGARYTLALPAADDVGTPALRQDQCDSACTADLFLQLADVLGWEAFQELEE